MDCVIRPVDRTNEKWIFFRPSFSSELPLYRTLSFIFQLITPNKLKEVPTCRKDLLDQTTHNILTIVRVAPLFEVRAFWGEWESFPWIRWVDMCIRGNLNGKHRNSFDRKKKSLKHAKLSRFWWVVLFHMAFNSSGNCGADGVGVVEIRTLLGNKRNKSLANQMSRELNKRSSMNQPAWLSRVFWLLQMMTSST